MKLVLQLLEEKTESWDSGKPPCLGEDWGTPRKSGGGWRPSLGAPQKLQYVRPHRERFTGIACLRIKARLLLSRWEVTQKEGQAATPVASDIGINLFHEGPIPKTLPFYTSQWGSNGIQTHRMQILSRAAAESNLLSRCLVSGNIHVGAQFFRIVHPIWAPALLSASCLLGKCSCPRFPFENVDKKVPTSWGCCKNQQIPNS